MQLNAQQLYSDFQRGVWELFKKVRTINYPDLMTYRQIRFLSAVGPAALSPDQLDRVSMQHPLFIRGSTLNNKDNILNSLDYY